MARALVGEGEFIEIFIDAPIAVAEAARPQRPLQEGPSRRSQELHRHRFPLRGAGESGVEDRHHRRFTRRGGRGDRGFSTSERGSVLNHSYVFNGDADGLCALQQLRLDGAPSGAAHHRRQARHRAAGAGDRRRAEGRSLHGPRHLARREPGRAARAARGGGRRSATSTTTSPAKSPSTRGWRRTSISARTSAPASSSTARSHGRFRRWAIVGLFGDSLGDEARALAAGRRARRSGHRAPEGARRRHQLQRLRRDARGPARPARRPGGRDGAVSPTRSRSPSSRRLPPARRRVPAGHGAGAPPRAGAQDQGRRLLHAARCRLGAPRQRNAGQRSRPRVRRRARSRSSRRRRAAATWCRCACRATHPFRRRLSAAPSPPAADAAPRPASTTCQTRISKNSPTPSRHSSVLLDRVRR